MKIVVIGTRGFPGVQGGVESHCEQLYTSMAGQGCDITVFTRRPYVSAEVKTYKGVKLIPVSCPRNKFFEALVHTFLCVLKAWNLHPDILHIHAVGPSLFTPFARMLGMKVVVTNHGPDYKRKKWSSPAKVFLKFCERMGMKFANEIITIAKNIEEDIQKNYGRGSTVIPNGVNIPQPADTDEYIKKYDLSKQDYILSVGRLVPEKGFDDLIDAYSQGNFKHTKLVIVGDADHEDNYSRNLKERASHHSNIVLTGFLTGQALHEIFSHAGLFVLPSYYEGMPIVLLEAMSFGSSCIASDIPANRNVELGDDRYFEPGDIYGLSRKIEKFIFQKSDDEDRKTQIETIAANYSWDKISKATLGVYNKIFEKEY